MMGRARVFVLQGYYGTGNFGDDWLLAASVAALGEASPGARFIVRDHGDPVAGPRHDNVTFSGSERVLGDTARPRSARLARYVAEAWRQLGAADWLVFGGGTQFHASGGRASLALNALLCVLARLRGVRVGAVGVGVKGIGHGLSGALLAIVLGCARVFAVRDPASRGIAGRHAVLGADLAFTAPLPRPPARAAAHAVAVAVYPEAWSEALAAAFAGGLEGREVVLLEVQRRGVTAGDGAVLDALAARLGGSATRRRMTLDGSALDGVGLVCGMRFHALLAAAQAGLAFVGIAHDPKIDDLCSRFGMPCLAPDRVSPASLAAALADAASRRPDPAALARCEAEAERGLAALRRALA